VLRLGALRIFTGAAKWRAMMNAHPGTEHLVVRMSPELRRAVEAAAEAEARTLSNFIRVTLAGAVKDRAAPEQGKAA
jgi:hypothetical protein